MSRTPLLLLGLTTASIAFAQDAAPSKPAYSADECAVWAREASFAQSVEDHDAKAFAEHLHADASFINGRDQVARGHEAVIAEWTPLIEGKDVRIHWYPDAVTVAGDTGVAISRGPYWIENPAPDAKDKFVAGRFISMTLGGSSPSAFATASAIGVFPPTSWNACLLLFLLSSKATSSRVNGSDSGTRRAVLRQKMCHYPQT